MLLEPALQLFGDAHHPRTANDEDVSVVFPDGGQHLSVQRVNEFALVCQFKHWDVDVPDRGKCPTKTILVREMLYRGHDVRADKFPSWFHGRVAITIAYDGVVSFSLGLLCFVKKTRDTDSRVCED